MRKIHQLPHEVVSKIAAGEVIERPVFAVKELIENAIDAGADAINIHIEESGLKKITVIDNGEGMSKEDLQESFKAHTTSKISHTDELSHITSLGFRGEALASIAAISRLTINSKPDDSTTGTSIVIKNGKLEKIFPIGMPTGTVVTVEQLFHFLPVRKKFLSSVRTEFRGILNLLISYALSYPSLHFVLTHNKKTILDLPKNNDLSARIEKLLGKDMFESFLPVSFENSYITITGFLAKPYVTTRTPNKQYLFINNRLVSDKGISLAVKSAYGSLLPVSMYPISLLYISLPYEMVDVNVHPRKEYVRFVDTTILYDGVKRAVLSTLESYDLTPHTGWDSLFLSDAKGSTESFAGKLLKEKKLPWELSTTLSFDHLTMQQLHNLYLFVITTNGFVLIDQHAAHERILYEQLLGEFVKEKKKQNIFHFSKPGIFELTFSESELLLEHLELFGELGWDIEHFKNTTFIVRSLPVLFQDRDYVKLLREMLEEMQDNGENSVDDISKRMITYLACRSAVKAGDKLTKKQAKDLVEQLEKTANNATCPHGRPTKVLMELEKINRLFKR